MVSFAPVIPERGGTYGPECPDVDVTSGNQGWWWEVLDGTRGTND